MLKREFPRSYSGRPTSAILRRDIIVINRKHRTWSATVSENTKSQASFGSKPFIKFGGSMNIQQSALAAALVVALSASSAYSQSNIATALQAKLAASAAKFDNSCGDEIKNFCSTVTPGEGREVLCIEAHEDKLSPKCLFGMHEAAKKLKSAVDTVKDATSACRDDIGKFCGQTPAGQGKLLQCLMTNKASVSKACADNIQKLSDFAAN